MKKILVLVMAISLSGCAEMQQVLNQLPQNSRHGWCRYCGWFERSVEQRNYETGNEIDSYGWFLQESGGENFIA